MSSSRTSTSSFFFNPPSFRVGLAILVTASMAIVSPSWAQSPARMVGRSLDRLPGTDAPPSMQSTVSVMVELSAPPAGVSYAAALKTAQAQTDAKRSYALANPKLKSSQAVLSQKQPVQISASAARQVSGAVQQIDQAQRAILPSLTSAEIGARVFYRVQRAYNGIAVQVSPDKISQIAKLPGVKAVHPMIPKSHTAFTDIDFLGTRTAWSASVPFGGAHGENVKVGVIDSGLDYVHTNFGGNADYTGVTDTNPNGHFPSFKAPGGYDFVGDAYNANDAVPIVAPDSNPWDGDPSGSSAGHGTDCASLVGGYGVDAGGTTYVGSYDAVNPIIGPMKISPGFAPNCKIYPLRVFGNSGSTNFVTPAIEWAMDPNGDGNFSDHLDVISMSLGSNEGYPDDDSAVSASIAASAGIIVCSASGNASDTYYITSSPAVAPGTLSVAASFNDQAGFIYNATITPNTNAGDGTPPDGKYKAIYGSASPKVGPGGLTGDVAYGVPNNAVTAFTNPASLAGKFVMVDRGGTNFTDMVQKSFNAGAIGCIVNNFNNPTADPIVMSTTGQPAIPAVMISKADRDEIVVAAGTFDPVTGLPVNSPVNVTLNTENGTVSRLGTGADTMPGYSSRGPSLHNTSLKPDITAPAEVVGVAENRTGSGVENFNGTSSATPHVAGAMALMRQLHPTWSVEELDALIMNTATHDLTTGPTPAPSPSPSPNTTYGVGRVGAGRMDIAKAATANVVAYNQTNPGLISVSFGVVEVPADGSTNHTKTVKVANKSGASVTYDITYQGVVPAAGASYVLPPSITVGAGATGNFNVTFNATGSALRHDRDPSVPDRQPTATNPFRQWLTEHAGYAVLTPNPPGPEPVIRVPLYAAPKPVSAMHATTTGVVPEAPSGTFNVNLSGLSINSGANYPNDIISLVKPFELQYASPLAGSPGASTDPNVIKYVGVTSDWTNRTQAQRDGGVVNVTFAIEGFGNATVPEFNSSDKEIFIDYDFDDIFDYAIFLTSRPNPNAGNAHTNVYRPILVILSSGGQIGMAGPTNLINPMSTTPATNARDTNSFNNSAVLIPVAVTGFVGTGFSSFNYQVVTFDRNGSQVDQSPVMFWDAAAPGMDTIPATSSASTVPTSGTLVEPFMFADLASTNIAVNYNGTNFQANGSRGLLLVHMHNGTGSRTDMVAFRKPTISSFTPTSGKVGAFITISGSNFGPGTVVTFFNNQVATNVNVLTANTLVAQVPAGAISGPIRVSNAAGFSSKGGFTVLP